MKKILLALLTLIILQPITVSAITDIYGNALPFTMEIPSNWVESSKEIILEKNKISYPAKTLQAFSPEDSPLPELQIFDTNVNDCVICNIQSIKYAQDVLKATQKVGLSNMVRYYGKHPSTDKNHTKSYFDSDKKILYLRTIQPIGDDSYALGTQVIFLREKENLILGFMSHMDDTKNDNLILDKIIASVEFEVDNPAMTDSRVGKPVKSAGLLHKMGAEFIAYGLIGFFVLILSLVFFKKKDE